MKVYSDSVMKSIIVCTWNPVYAVFLYPREKKEAEKIQAILASYLSVGCLLWKLKAYLRRNGLIEEEEERK